MTTRNARGRTVAIVQARATSRRLPGKVLLPVEGKPMLVRQLERVCRAESLDEVVVATSTDSTDDDIEAVADALGIRVVRGPLDDVLARYVLAADISDAEVAVRITADCPLISPSVMDQVVGTFHAAEFDYVSNTLTPTYPDGLDVEVTTAQVLWRVSELSDDEAEREHVTLGIYRRPEEFALGNFVDPSGFDHSSLRWTVDEAEDLEFVRSIYAHLYPVNPAFDYRDVLDLLKANPQLHRTVQDTPRNAALDGLDTGAIERNNRAETT
jgi:spore coat polysaccharide biosynthesis protein SpsF